MYEILFTYSAHRARVAVGVQFRKGHHPYRHQAHDRTIYSRRNALLAHRRELRPPREDHQGRGWRHEQHTPGNGQGRLRPLPGIHGHGLARDLEKRHPVTARRALRRTAKRILSGVRAQVGGSLRFQQRLQPRGQQRRGGEISLEDLLRSGTLSRPVYFRCRIRLLRDQRRLLRPLRVL